LENFAAVQVAVQLPHPIHHLNEGSCCSTNREIEKSFFSKSICRPFNMEYPQSFTVSVLIYINLRSVLFVFSEIVNNTHRRSPGISQRLSY
jgi:hypothetical protein